MEREVFQGSDGFTFGRTELRELCVTKDGCHDAVAWSDLDGDGCIDLIGVETQNGHDDADHELVGLHVPSGKVVWRALTGEVSRQVGLVNGVLVCATNERTTLRGVDPRSGAPLWQLRLEDTLEDGPYDGFDGARAITASGPAALFECDDGTAYAIDAQSGRGLLRHPGKLACHTLNAPGLVCLRGEEDFRVVDLMRNQVVFQAPEEDVGFAVGAGKVAFFHFDPPEGTHTTVIDLQSRQVVAKASIKLPDGKCPNLHQVCDDAHAGVILDNGAILKGKRYDENVTIIDIAKRTAIQQPPPRPGLVFWQMERQGNLLFIAYQKKDGTPHITLSVWNAQNLTSIGNLEGFGGYSIPSVLFPVPSGMLVAKSVLKDGGWKRNNPVSWWHMDPASGQKVTEYPVQELGCVEVHGKFLCGLGDVYGTCYPVVYDTDRRERVL